MTTALVTYTRGAYVDQYGHQHPALTIKRKTTKKKRTKKRRSAKKKNKWFDPKTSSGWKKTQPASIRRKLLLKAHKGSLLSAARSKQALANVTQDEETRILALKDARYFFEQYKKEKKSD